MQPAEAVLSAGLWGNGTGGTISDCNATGEIRDIDPKNFGSCAGGLAESILGTISSCHASGNVGKFRFINFRCRRGALAGIAALTAMSHDCYATGQVSFSGHSTNGCNGGGLVGMMASNNLSGCYSSGRINCETNSESGYYVEGPWQDFCIILR